MTQDNVLVALIAVSVGASSKERRAAAGILLRVLQARREGAAPLSTIVKIIGAEAGAEVAREIRVLIEAYKLR